MVKLIVAPSVSESLRVAAILATEKERETVLFTEDKCTVSLERAVLSALSGGVSFHAEVVSFSRFFKKYGGQISALSKEGSSMLIRRILAESEGEFALLPPVGGKKNLASALYDMLAQLKSACVGAEELQRAAQGASGLFQKKLSDLALLSSKYAQALKETGKTDQSGLMNLLPAFLRSSRILQGKKVVLAGYTAFTRQMEGVITAIIASGAEVTAVLPAGTCMRAQAVECFLRAVKAAGEPVLKEEISAGESTGERLRSLFYSPESYAGEGKLSAKGISIYRADTPEGEVERLALTVIARVRGGARYRDFSVVCADTLSYSPLFIRIFKKYQIPVYTDVKYTLARHPLARFVLSVLGVSAYGATFSAVREVVNSAYFPEKEGVPAFLAYAKRAGVVGNRFYQPFHLPLPGVEQAEKVRILFSSLCPQIKQKARAGEYLTFISELLQRANVREESAKITEEMRLEYPELADFTRQAPERLTELLAETERILGNTPITVAEFYDVINAGLQAVETSVLPTRLDAVTVAPPDKACVKESKYVFALGMTADFPTVTEDTAFLSERDLLELEERGVSVDPNLQEMNERSRMQAVYALTSFTENLVLSYPALSFSGETNTESEIITILKRNCRLGGELIAEITEGELLKKEESLPKEKRLSRKANAYLTETAALERYFKGLSAYTEGEKEDLEEESGYFAFVAEKDGLHGTTHADFLSVGERLPEGVRGTENIPSVAPKAISATAIQTYFSCPYKYFLSKTLGVQEPQEIKIAANESGTLIHAVYEAFGKEMMQREVEIEEIPALVKQLFTEVLDRPEFAVKRGQVRNEVAFSRLLEEAVRGATALYEHFARSSLRITAVEKNLIESFEKAPLFFHVGNRKIPLTGVVDRIDENDEFFRIVDYKTGSVKCSLSELYTGRHLQLELYLLAVQNLLKKRPAGGYYFFSKDAYEETPQPIRLYGKTLKEENALYAQDRSFAVKGETPQESMVLPYTVSINKKGETQYKGDGAKNLLLSEEDFSAHLNYAFRVAQKALTELENGFIYPTPYEGGCKWCKYQSICGRSADFYGEGRKVTARIENEDILLALSEEEVNEDAR
ncbi:MAG: hypothetical protein E7363_03635 [Clostridiales bacterium]|nr:hypothetical protein [Clostridiales bacterium]